MSIELISVLSFLCGIAVGWFLIGIFSLKKRAENEINIAPKSSDTVDTNNNDVTISYYGFEPSQRKSLIVGRKNTKYSWNDCLIHAYVLLDADWYVEGDILIIEYSQERFKVLYGPRRDGSSFLYCLEPLRNNIKHSEDVDLRPGNFISCLIPSGRLETSSNERSRHYPSYSRITYPLSSDNKNINSKNSDMFEDTLTNLLLSPISPISIWNSSDDNSSSSSSSTYDSSSYDSGSFDCGGDSGGD